jgi:ribonuclease HII
MVEEVDLEFSNKNDADIFLAGVKEKYGVVIAGLDEVGRGPLAASVVVGCVILPPDHKVVGIKDSKKLTPKKRESISEEIMEVATWGIGVCEAEEIDELNIHRAIRKAAQQAMAECVSKLVPDFILADGGLDLRAMSLVPTTSIIKGDQWFECIGAASILAKVYRDQQMAIYHEMWPEYNFKSNQGYGTKEHLEAIRKHGLSPIHRKSFGICRGYA